MTARAMSIGCAMMALLFGACAKEVVPPQKNGVRVDVVARGLQVPWSLALAPDGRLFVAERVGRIRVIAHDTLQAEPWAEVPAADGSRRNVETGLMGLALDPDFASRPYVYVCYTEQRSDRTIVNRVVRLREQAGHGVDPTPLINAIPAGPYHNGCRVKVGPDRKLYVTMGDAYTNDPAQDAASLLGKVLRIELDGSIPKDNPFPGSPVWSLGHRNPQGIAWDPKTGQAIVTEHGTGNVDEINMLERGANYGWPEVKVPPGGPRFEDPAMTFHVAPTGAVFLPDSGSPRYLLVASLHGRLIRLAVDGQNVTVAEDSVLAGYGRLRDVILAGDGSVYVSTSNRDGRGKAQPGDDRVLRVWLRR